MSKPLAKQYGHLRTIGVDGRRGVWTKCSCGVVRQFALEALQSGAVVSCGECQRAPRPPLKGPAR
jgi:hypothetical protein